MSYKLNKTDGSLLVDLVDGQLDTTSSDLTLIGRNYSGFGEVLNENFIQLLENFSNATAPINPLRGQLWFDTTENRLKVYNGSAFVASGGTTVSNTQPNMVAGDIWINNETSQLYFFDGTNLKLVGPVYSNAQGTSGFEVVSLLDTQNVTQHVIKMFVAGSLVGVHANAVFTPVATGRITELVSSSNPNGEIKKGFNTVGTDYKYIGTATVAEALVDGNGTIRNADSYLVSDGDDTTVGALTIQNNAGLTVGLNNNTKLQFTNNAFTIANQLTGQDVEIKVRNPAELSALKVDATNSRVGIYKVSPTKTLDVGGDVNIDGNLVVAGTTTSIDVQDLRVEDKNIELAIDSNGNVGNDAAVDGGGIILKSSQGDKSFVWQDGTDSWTSSEFIDLAATKGIKINTNTVLTETALGASVTTAPGLTILGTLTQLVVDDVTVDGSSVFTSANSLQLGSNGPITVLSSNRITGVGSPVNDSDVATKGYTDGSTVIGLDMNVTGLNMASPYNDVRDELEKLFPAGGYTLASPNRPTNANFSNSVIPARGQGALARVRAVNYGSGGGFSIPSIPFAGLKNFTPVDQTITIQQRTIQTVTTYSQDNSLGTTTKITCSASHYYEAGQAVVLTGTTFSGGIGTIDGNYTVQSAEFSAESPNFVSLTINYDSQASGLNGANYNAASGTIERTPVVGNANKQVVEDFSDPTGVTGQVTFAPTTTILQFGVNNGVWEFDRTIP